MSEGSKKFFVVITKDAYDSEVAFAGLRFALTALVQGHSVKLFLLASGALIAVRNQAPDLGANMGKWLNDIKEEGGEIKACGICLKTRGITKEILLDSVQIGSMGDLVEAAAESDVQMTF